MKLRITQDWVDKHCNDPNVENEPTVIGPIGPLPYRLKHILRVEKVWNPLYDQDRLCECGHPYYRHFDTYDEMNAIGCKYCQCYEFKETL